MSIPRLSFDPARLLTIYFRIERDGSRLLVFKNPDGTDYDVTTSEWEFFIKHKSDSTNKVMSLTIGDGLTFVDTNKIQIDFTAENTNVREKEYFYELLNTTTNETWLNGAACAHDGKFDDKSSENTVTIALLGNEIILTVVTGGSSAPSGPVDWDQIILDSVVSTVNIGGITIGYDTDGKSLKEFVEDLIAPYIDPAFTSFGITGQALTVEVGTTISGNKTVTWAIAIGSGTVATIDIMDDTSETVILANTPNDGSQVVNFPAVQLNADGAQRAYKGKLHDTDVVQDIDSNPVTITARYLRFYGPASSEPSNSAQVRALPSSAFQTANANTFTLNTGTVEKDFYVALAPGRTIATAIDLSALNATVVFTLIGTINVLDAGGTNRSYNLYGNSVAIPYSTNHQFQITTA